MLTSNYLIPRSLSRNASTTAVLNVPTPFELNPTLCGQVGISVGSFSRFYNSKGVLLLLTRFET